MELKTRAVLAILLLTGGIWGAVPSFERVPAQAMSELKGARGQKLDTGLVFVNGRYLKPPYVIARYGTAIYVNDVQVTDQIVPWRSFLATQEGYVPPAKPAAPAPAVPAPSEAKSLDDLFDDAVPEPAAQPKPATPAPAEQEEASVPYKHNAHTDQLLKRIDAARTDVQRKLREGNACFFGVNYARVVIEPRLVKTLMTVLPEGMRDADDALDLESKLRAGGIVFINRQVCKDLLDNRADYLKLNTRRKQLLEEEAAHRKSNQERAR